MTAVSDPASTIGVFGGSFDPPHIAHVLAASYALSMAPIQRLLVIPTFQHAFAKPLAEYRHRYRMTRLAFGQLRHVVVSPIERELGATSYTIRTLTELHRRLPNAQFRLIVGSDVFSQRDDWKDFDEVTSIAPLFVIPRAEVGRQGMLPMLSSSEIRDKLHRGEAVDEFVPRRVLAYIHRYDVYPRHER